MGIKRIPYADRKKVKALPAEAKVALSMMKNKVGVNEYKELENLFVDIVDIKEDSPVGSEKTLYGGSLGVSPYNIKNLLGAYNPDNIPAHIYERMSKHHTIALGLAVIVNSVTALKWRINCDNVKLRLFLTKVIKKIYRETSKSLANAVRLGCAIGEKCWDYQNVQVFEKTGEESTKILDGDYWVLKKIKFVHPRTIRIKIDDKGNFNGIVQDDGKGHIVSVKPNKTVLYSHNIEFGNYFGESRLKNIYPSWYWCSVIVQFMLRYLERCGQPVTVVSAPPGKSTDADGNQVDNMKYALKIGQAITGNSVVAKPKILHKEHNVDMWTIEQLKDDQRGDMFRSIINYFESTMLRGLFIPDRMGLAADGSPHATSGTSAGDTLDVFMMTEQDLCGDIEDVWNCQIIPYILAYNFKKEDIVDASLVIEKLDLNSKLLMKDVFLRMIMLAAGTLRDGKKPEFLPSIRRLSELLDIPIDEFDKAFEDMPLPEQPGMAGENVQNSPRPSADKKNKQDKNNSSRSTGRKDRSSRERSARERKQA